MTLDRATALRAQIDEMTYADEAENVMNLIKTARLSKEDRARISASGAELVRRIRDNSDPGLMEVFLAEYGLSTDEGVALMCLAEALLRVPDPETIDALIEDKIASSDWGRHMGHSTSPLVNASTWALMLTGRVLREEAEPGPVGHLRAAVKRLGEPVIRTAVGRAMKEMGRQFVLGEDIRAAMKRASGMEAKGFTYSYDMLGEAARTDADAMRYHAAYGRAIEAIGKGCVHDDVRRNPGISVKLSALHPRYEEAQKDRVMTELYPRLRDLALMARGRKMGLNIDAEEADRLSISIDLIEKLMHDPALAGWDGLGVVVQAFGHRCGAVLEHLYALADEADRKISARLVKGAYWDTEIKLAQVEGLESFPVFTSKPATDVSYIANARRLLGMTDRIYPQFATHNAHTVAAILDMAEDKEAFEFQRLHGMGEALHTMVLKDNGTRCRIYAPVGAHKDLLAYLVRRLLENGANSSFVNQIVDEDVAPEIVARDPFEALNDTKPFLPTGPELYQPERVNSRGWDLAHRPTLAAIDTARAPWRDHQWDAGPLLAKDANPETATAIRNPARTDDTVGTVRFASAADCDTALARAKPWTATPAERGAILSKAADLYEANYGELFALLAREPGKTLPDAVAELREAVDFLRYYAANAPEKAPVGVFTCISPWNFPLAIFTGQVSAALAAGNAVLAKPAEQTPLIAARAVALLHEAGVPREVLQYLPGAGGVGAALTSDARVGGVAFTGSTDTAMIIRRAMAENLAPGAPLLAETGGLNAMIVDSTALPEQAVASIVESAFQSAGQRCSALRCLYVQRDIAGHFVEMLIGAMEALRPGQPWDLSTDLGPVIDAEAQSSIAAYIAKARADGRVIKQTSVPKQGHFIAPTLLRVNGINEMEREIFGPVLHLATFEADELDKVIDTINATGFGLTFGLHTRIDDRVQHVSERIHAGNIYVNRNQIGAIVGSQPFGGEGLSGTGPKAGGPNYLARFGSHPAEASREAPGAQVDPLALQEALKARELPQPQAPLSLPGPTGESNRLTALPRPPVLCLGPGDGAAQAQKEAVERLGGVGVRVGGALEPEALTTLSQISGALWWGDAATARRYAQALSNRKGPILPLITGMPDKGHVTHERHVCVDTTASGGNAALLSGMS
ncbi:MULTISPECIES: bifunctional proline dehydrogenase/L-glutamate gamma-semialdehyde dehydrogenase PutA [unclassified Marinovum]